MMYSKGYAAEETKAAVSRATQLSTRSDNFAERFAAFHGLWALAMVRGELRPAREMASTFLNEAEDAGCVVEAAVAHRALAMMCYFTGDFLGARNPLRTRARSLRP